MNRTVLSATLALLLSGSLAFAQAPQTPAPDAQQPATQPAPAHRPSNPHRQAKRMAKQLNLTPDQTARLEPILAERNQKVAALRSDSSLSPLAERQQMRAIRKSTEQQLSSLLTPQQMQQFKAMRSARAHHAQPQAFAPTA